MTDVATHYATADPAAKVERALEVLAPGGPPLSPDQLAGFDDFHTAGRTATERIAELLAPGSGDTVLDAGSGLGGPARYLAQTFGCRVIGARETWNCTFVIQRRDKTRVAGPHST